MDFFFFEVYVYYVLDDIRFCFFGFLDVGFLFLVVFYVFLYDERGIFCNDIKFIGFIFVCVMVFWRWFYWVVFDCELGRGIVVVVFNWDCDFSDGVWILSFCYINIFNEVCYDFYFFIGGIVCIMFFFYWRFIFGLEFVGFFVKSLVFMLYCDDFEKWVFVFKYCCEKRKEIIWFSWLKFFGNFEIYNMKIEGSDIIVDWKCLFFIFLKKCVN